MVDLRLKDPLSWFIITKNNIDFTIPAKVV